MKWNSRRVIQILFVWIVECSFLCGLAAGKSVDSKLTSTTGKRGVARGTINVFLANRNGMVVLTDSRLTDMGTMQPLPDPCQKLFQLDPWTVATFAGFASEPLRMDPEVASATADLIRDYAVSLSAHRDRRLSPREKLVQLSFILQKQLELITAINGDQPSGRNYDLEITVAGYDRDGVAKIEQVDLGLRSVTPFYAVSVSGQREQVVGSRLSYSIRGIEDVAQDVLDSPTKYPAEPAVVRYVLSQEAGGTALTLEEMESLARFLARKTGSVRAGVGGPEQMAVLESGTIKRLELPAFPPSKPRSSVPFLIIWEEIIDGNVGPPISAVGSRTLLFINNTVRREEVILDDGYFFGNAFSDCSLRYNNGRMKFVDGGNDVRNSALVLGPKIDRNSPELKRLLSLRWREVMYEAPIPPERPLPSTVHPQR
jgi:20S proteasome alpha/beta subunit